MTSIRLSARGWTLRLLETSLSVFRPERRGDDHLKGTFRSSSEVRRGVGLSESGIRPTTDDCSSEGGTKEGSQVHCSEAGEKKVDSLQPTTNSSNIGAEPWIVSRALSEGNGVLNRKRNLRHR